ncbi:Regulatory protein BlaR1 [Polystyrenella longa]|uniref:Regulatory protein BlaR1 n=1 Tax=Polystyrenella longa TaxID=2528007 RepID=A0A518CT68_9PLAN|nr:M56 family metallopeptidase [Polystyrenella longa]QDU82422.1 Regulatory protein BlaR1 [Polystyrenella longa]
MLNSLHFLETAITLSVQITFVVGLTWGLNQLIREERKRCRLWTCSYALILLLVGLAVAAPHPRLFHPWKSFSTESLVTLAEFEQKSGQALLLIWLIGFVATLMLMAFRFCLIHRFLKRCQKLEQHSKAGKELYQVLLDSQDNFNRLFMKNRPIQVLVSSEVTTPFCWQFHSPYVVLPEYLIGFEPTSIEYIVRHELEHLQTGHPLQLFLQRLVEALFWFHPLVWWATRKSDLHREFACDEAAIQTKQEIVEYLRTLLTIVEYTTSHKDNLPSSLNFSRGRQAIARRAERLVMLASANGESIRAQLPCHIAMICLVSFSLLISWFWLPLNVLASTRSNWSPWPKWSASVLHDLGVPARDFEIFSQRTELDEMKEHLSQQRKTRE